MMTIIQILSHDFKQNKCHSFGYSAVKLSHKKPVFEFSDLSPVPSLLCLHKLMRNTLEAAGTPG